MDLSIVVSVYNEESNLNIFYKSVTNNLSKLNIEYELIFVNDGSCDKSKEILNELYEQDSIVKVVHFSKNFGHEAAMIAGIDLSIGNATICIDADMQNPPELIEKMYNTFLYGNDIILMKRIERKDKSFFSKYLSSMFYKFLNYLSPLKFEPNASDFFLLSRRVVNIIKNNFREKNRFLRGFIQTLGFKKTILEYIAPARYSGKSNYNYLKLFKLSFNAITSFSEKPLNLGILLGVIIGIFAFIIAVYSIINFFVDKPVSGYTTIVVLISFISSANLLVLGFIGKYIANIYNEIKNRPIYIIEDIKKH